MAYSRCVLIQLAKNPTKSNSYSAILAFLTGSRTVFAVICLYVLRFLFTNYNFFDALFLAPKARRQNVIFIIRKRWKGKKQKKKEKNRIHRGKMKEWWNEGNKKKKEVRTKMIHTLNITRGEKKEANELHTHTGPSNIGH